MANDNANVGHFLDYSLWEEAIRLLDFQIARKKKNRHYNTLTMFYYERLGDAVSAVKSEEYFKNKVINNLFYGLEKEFTVIPYVIPKSGLGLRNYRFFTYPLRVLYYAIGLYLLKLSQEFLTEYVAKRKKVKSFYGGGIYFKNNSLQLTSRNTYFREYYSEFKRQIRSVVENDADDKVVIRIDIQNYYDTLPVKRLLEQLTRKIKTSHQKKMVFDATTKEQISSLLKFTMNQDDGIPQADNDLISSFIGHLHLVFGDLFIEDLILIDRATVRDYSVIRYVDDTFIALTFNSELEQQARENYVESFASRVVDMLYYELGLKLNDKTRLFWLNNPAHVRQLLNSLKKVSPKHYVAPDEESIFDKVTNIFEQLEKLKQSQVDLSFTHDLAEEILKEVFDPRVEELLSKSDNRLHIERIFANFNFNLIRTFPLPLLIILLKAQDATERFKQFLLSKQELTTNDVDLILTFLCQTGFEDKELLTKLRQYPPMRKIMEMFMFPDLALEYPGYFVLDADSVKRLCTLPYVIEQIRLRVVSERMRSYSVALNHLLNEMHAICFELDPLPQKDHKNYNANNAIDFLQSRHVPHAHCISILNLFDRRNTNQVSHPGSEDVISWGVNEEEYYEYRMQVGESLRYLL